MQWQSGFRSATVAAALLVWAGCAAAYADCLPSTRNIKFPDGSTQVRTYVCRLNDTGAPGIEVEFDRLSETAAGNLVENTPYPELTSVLGLPQLVQNDVLRNVKEIFDKYGTRQTTKTCYAFSVNTAVKGAPDYTNASNHTGESQHCEDERVLWYLLFPDQENLTTIGMPLLDEQQVYSTTTHWPEGWNFFYRPLGQDCGPPWISCALIWRPAHKSDLSAYWDEVKKERERFEAGLPQGVAADQQARDEQQAADDGLRRYFSLVEYLNGNGWQDGFLTITGLPPNCGDGIEFNLHTRQLILDIAVVKNVTSEPLSLDGLLGSMDPTTGLREVSGSTPGGPANVLASSPPITLAPGGSAAIPLKISFVPAGGPERIFQNGLEAVPIDRAGAARTYQSIMAASPGTIFSYRSDDAAPDVKPVRKLRESFGAPSVPNLPNYVYGAVVNLSGLIVNGKHIDLTASARNFFRIAAGEGYGSCPHLYGYDDKIGTWVWRGKIIHNAHDASREITQRVDFPGLVTRFSIREEELEVSYIHHVELELLLSDGLVRRLSASTPITHERSDGYTVISAGEGHEFSFEPPQDIRREMVKQSTLVVTGYYDPYSSLALTKSR